MRSPPRQLLALASVVAGLLVWELGVRLGWVDARLVPSPTSSFAALRSWSSDGSLAHDVAISLRRILVGYFFGALSGTITGIFTGTSKGFELVLGPWIRACRSISPVALVPYGILLFGLSETGKYAVVGWGVFFTLWVGAHVGVAAVDRETIGAARSLGLSRARLLMEVYPMSALTILMSSARAGIAIAFICVVVAEMTGAGATEGLGYRIAVSYQIFRTDLMMAALVVIGVLGAAFDYAFVSAVRRLFPWIRIRTA